MLHTSKLIGGKNMFKLIKLAFYAAVGYAIYELYLGMTQGREEGSSGGGGGSSRYGAITGGGEGMEIESEDESGTSIPHHVGRGVVR